MNLILHGRETAGFVRRRRTNSDTFGIPADAESVNFTC